MRHIFYEYNKYFSLLKGENGLDNGVHFNMSDQEAMIRWQNYARESRTAVNSHFLTYTAGILAFQTSILVNKDILSINWPCIFVIGGGLAILSLILGSIVVLIRLRDARLTARIARFRHIEKIEEDINSLQKQTHCLGKWTNQLIPLQVISFVISSVFFIIWVVGTHSGKLVGVVN